MIMCMTGCSCVVGESHWRQLKKRAIKKSVFSFSWVVWGSRSTGYTSLFRADACFFFLNSITEFMEEFILSFVCLLFSFINERLNFIFGITAFILIFTCGANNCFICKWWRGGLPHSFPVVCIFEMYLYIWAQFHDDWDLCVCRFLQKNKKKTHSELGQTWMMACVRWARCGPDVIRLALTCAAAGAVTARCGPKAQKKMQIWFLSGGYVAHPESTAPVKTRCGFKEIWRCGPCLA